MLFADAPGRARRMVKHGDIIWSTVRPNRRSYSLILNPPSDLIVSTGFAVISAKNAPYTYLYQALTTAEFVGYLINHAKGAAYPAVSSEDFEDANILLPTKDLLDLYNITISDIFDETQNLNYKNLNLGKTRDLLLPRLIMKELKIDGLNIKQG